MRDLNSPTADRDAIKHVILEFFRAVTFEPEARPGYEAIHSLFIDSGLLIRNTMGVPEINSVAEFIRSRQTLVETGELSRFREFELFENTQIFGNVAQRFSAYAKSGMLGGTSFEGRGMICTQFVRTPSGWKISSMAWDDERPLLALPG